MEVKPQGNVAPEATNGTGAPEAQPSTFSADEFNKAFSARAKAQEAKLAKLFEEKLAALTSQLSAPREPPAPEPRNEESPGMRALQNQLAEQNRRLEELQAARVTETQKARELKLHSTVSEKLQAGGVNGIAVKGALALLKTDQRLQYDEDGETPLWRDDNGEPLPLEVGISKWLKTDEAKLYLSPRNAVGSGSVTGNAPRRLSGVQKTESDMAVELAQILGVR